MISKICENLEFGTSFFSWKHALSSFIQKSIKSLSIFTILLPCLIVFSNFVLTTSIFFLFFCSFAWQKVKNPKGGSVLTMTTMSGCLPKSLDSNLKMTTRLPSKVRIRDSYPAFFYQDYSLRCLPLPFFDTTSFTFFLDLYFIRDIKHGPLYQTTKLPILFSPFFQLIFLSLSS